MNDISHITHKTHINSIKNQLNLLIPFQFIFNIFNVYLTYYTKFIFLILTTIIIIPITKTQFLEFSIIPSETKLSKTTQHQLVFYIPAGGSDIPNNSYFILTYDNRYDLTSLSNGPQSGDFCQTGCNINSINILNQGNNVLKITGFFPTLLSTNINGYTIVYTLSGIKNPSSLLTNSLSVQIDGYDSTNAPLIFLSNLIVLSTTIADMSCQIKSSSNPTVSQLTNFTFLIKPSISLPSNGFIYMDFPTIYSTSDSSSLLSISSSFSCSSNITDGSIINCTKINSTRYKIQTIFATSRTLPFEITFGQLKNPDTQQPLNDIKIRYLSSSGNWLTQCQTILSSSIIQHYNLSDLSFNLNNINITTSQAVAQIKFTTTHYAQFNDQLKIQIDPSYSLANLTLMLAFIGNQTTTINRQLSINNSQVLSKKIISVLPFEASQPTNYTIQLYQFILPQSLSPTINITVSILRKNYLIAKGICCNQTLLQNSTSPLVVSLSLKDNKIGQYTQYYFSIQSLHRKNVSKLQIQFPSEYALSIGSCQNQFVINSNLPNPVCTIVSSTLIQISSLQSILYINYPFRFTIKNILNPPLNSPIIKFKTISLITSYQIQTVNVTISLITTIISSAKVYVSPLKVFSSATYFFQINNTNLLSAGSKVHIYSPQEIIFYDNVTNNCFLGIISLTCNKQSNSYLIVNLPPLSTFSPNTLSNSNLSIQNSVQNPLSTKPSKSFKIQLQSLSNIIQGTSNGIFVQMNILESFSNLSIIPNSNITFQETSYQINFNLPYDISLIPSYFTPILVITFPNDFLLIDCSLCKNKSEIAFAIISNVNSIIIQKIRNPQFSIITNYIKVDLLMKSSLSVLPTKQPYYQSISQNVLISNWISRDQSFLIFHDHLKMGQDVTIFVSIQNLPNSVKIIEITVPNQYTITSGNFSIEIDSSLGNTAASTLLGNKISISNIVLNSKNITLKIKTGMKCPISSPSSNWRVQTFFQVTPSIVKLSTSSLTSQTLNPQKFQTICVLPCKECSQSTNTSFCLSCYNNPLISTFSYLYKNQCISSCSSSSYQISVTNSSSPSNIIKQCYDCSASCLTCSMQAYNCTSCILTKNLFKITNQCIDQCPDGYFSLLVNSGANKQCTLCTPPCYSCLTSSTQCKSCTAGNLLIQTNKTCSPSCPNGYYNRSNICQSCSILSSNCSTCDSINGCTLCANFTYLFASQCLVSCPKSFYIGSAANSTLICQSCKTPCLTCSVTSSKCTSCDLSSSQKYYFNNNNSCLTSCPSTYYPNQNFICLACVSPCLQCSSLTNCTNCITNYSLISQFNQCVSQCPNTNPYSNSSDVSLAIRSLKSMIKVLGECQVCQSPCQTCQTSINNCTSCIQSYFLLNGSSNSFSCVLDCSLHNLISYLRVCRKCYPPCLDCVSVSSPTQCLICQNPYYLLSTSCFLICPSGTFKILTNGTIKICQLCTTGCYQCQNTSSTCLSCQPGLYLNSANHTCNTNCPTTPIYYYEFQAQCLQCQSQCISCLTSPIQCSACSDPSIYKYNLRTKECTLTCSSIDGYFNDFLNSSQCRPCELPCKTCSNYYNNCSQCFNGKFLHISGLSMGINPQLTCLDTCPLQFYPNMINNTCQPCSNSLCQQCNQNKCLICKAGFYIYQGICYSTCPAQAQYVYQNTYCRNCLKDHCLLCSQQSGQCIMCQQNYFGYNGSCLSQCLQNYQPDTFTSTKCVMKEQSALKLFLQFKQKLKMFPFAGTIIFISLFPLMFTIKALILQLLNSLLSIPQTVSYIFFTFLVIFYSQLIPFYVPLALILIHLTFSIIHTILALNIFLNDKDFLKWYDSQDFPSNKNRTKIVFIFSFINKRLIYLLFSGCNWFAFTTYRLQNLNKFKPLNIITILMLIIVQLPYFCISIAIIIIQKAYLDNNKLLFSCLDICIINLISFIITIWQLKKRQQFPQPFKRFIIKNVSTVCYKNQDSIYGQQQLNNQDDNQLNLHRSGSDQNLCKKNANIQQIQMDYKSVYDPNDFQDIPQVDTKYIHQNILKGKFRKKKKKVKKFFHQQLDKISQQQQSSEQEQSSKKKKRKTKKTKVGYMNNYIYWKAPKQKKKQQIVKTHINLQQKQIMQKIKQKQSQFDTITRNDLVFQEDQNDHQLNYKSIQISDSDYGDQKLNENNNYNNRNYFWQGSPKQIQIKKRDQINAYFNLNYAGRKHLS